MPAGGARRTRRPAGRLNAVDHLGHTGRGGERLQVIDGRPGAGRGRLCRGNNAFHWIFNPRRHIGNGRGGCRIDAASGHNRQRPREPRAPDGRVLNAIPGYARSHGMKPRHNRRRGGANQRTRSRRWKRSGCKGSGNKGRDRQRGHYGGLRERGPGRHTLLHHRGGLLKTISGTVRPAPKAIFTSCYG